MLSLIVTFYDETAFLRTALRSVLNQQIEALEVIVINDNPERFSKNDLADLTRGFGVRVVHHHENRGLSAARNTGISAANGSHVGFLDGDDYFCAGGLARQWAYALETGADITHAATYLGHEGSVHASVLPRDRRLHLKRRVVTGRMAAQEAQFIVSSWASLYRADFLAQNDLWFDVEQRKFEDRLFVLHAVTAARKIAFLGDPVRVWRRRANSISSSKTTPETHLLQVQLLEKCLAHMRDAFRNKGLPERFEKRELFNALSRLIWDMDILEHLAEAHPDYIEMGARVQALLGDERFGQAIFDDPMVRATSRVGMNTRKGLISRTDFFDLHRAMREGDFKTAHALMAERRPQPRAAAKAARHSHKRLVLHVGLHKTGTTFVQHHLLHHREALRRAGVLVPQTGFEEKVAGRPGALSGHQGLVQALRQSDARPWQALHKEIAQSTARTVLISAENLGFPTAPDREALIAELFQRLGVFSDIEVVAMARAPQDYVEAFHAEWVVSAHPSGGRGLEEMLVDHAESLLNLQAMFAPFEANTGQPVRLADFDALRKTQGLWPGFCALAGLPEGLHTLDLPRYPTPDRASVSLLQIMNITVTDRSKRQRLMDTYFAGPMEQADRQSQLSPARRLALLEQFEAACASFAAERGYAPDIMRMRADIEAEDWQALSALPVGMIEALVDVGTQIAGETSLPQPQRSRATIVRQAKRGKYEIRFRPRPWVVRLLDAFVAGKDHGLALLKRRN